MTVITRDGHKHPEKPKSFIFRGTVHDVVEIIARSVEETVHNRYRTFRFQVRCHPPLTCTLIYHPSTGQWYLAQSQ